jgi:zinc transport system ATP-binding protein
MLLSVNNLNVHFGSQHILDSLNFEVPEQSFFTVIGPNGAGKTVLTKTVMGLLEPSEGEVRLLGKLPRKVPFQWLGYVPQLKTMDRSFPALAIELVVSGLRGSWPAWISAMEWDQAESALEKVGAGHLRNRTLAELSGGELQRVYLARSLIRKPKLVILDEPATGIDVVGEHDMYELLEKCRENSGCSIMMVTHDHEVAYHHSTHVLVLNHRQIGFGTPKEILREEYLRQAFGHHDHSHEVGAPHTHVHDGDGESGRD